MLSSIWVATTTGLPAFLHSLIIVFCTEGTFSRGNSTPRSPLAIIIPSASAMISLMFFSADGFSIFAITEAFEPTSFFNSLTLSTVWIKDRAIQSAPISNALFKSLLSFDVREEIGRIASGMFTPLLSEISPSFNTSTINESFFCSIICIFNLPSLIKMNVLGVNIS